MSFRVAALPIAWIGEQRHCRTVRNAVLRSHRIERHRITVVSDRVAADSDTNFLHLVYIERRRATQTLQELDRTLNPAADRVHLDPYFIYRPGVSDTFR